MQSFMREGNRLVLYTIGWMIFVMSVIESFIGYILVWGNMSYWGASVIINILAIVPLIGNVLVKFIWCSSIVVLNFAITIHFLVGLIIIALITIHILYLHNVSSSSPFINSSSSLMIPFFPIFFKDLFAIILLFLFCSYNFFFEVEAIYGNVQNLIPASPTATPTHILPEWYYLLFYSILRAFPSKVYGAIMVLLFFIFLIKTIPSAPVDGRKLNYTYTESTSSSVRVGQDFVEVSQDIKEVDGRRIRDTASGRRFINGRWEYGYLDRSPSIPALPASDNSSEEIVQIEKEIVELEKESVENVKEIETEVKKLEELEKELEKANKEVEIAEKNVEKANKEIERLDKEILEIEKEMLKIRIINELVDLINDLNSK